MQNKQLDWKDQVNLKIHDTTTWLTNKCNTRIGQNPSKLKQPGNETWSINRL